MKRIIFISKNIPIPDFDDNPVVLRQAKLLNKKSYQVDVLYPREIIPKFFKIFGGRYKALSMLPNKFISYEVEVDSGYYVRLPIKNLEWKFCKLLNKRNLDFKNYDLIHSHFIFPDALIASSIAKKYNIPHVVTIREGDYINLEKSPVNKSLFYNVLDKVDGIITMTPSLSRGLSKIHDSKKFNIPSFVHSDFFEKKIKKVNASEHYIKFTVISKLISRKNIDWIIDFFLNNKKLDIKLSICGDGPLKRELMEKSSFDNRISFLGQLSRDEIISVLDDSDVFLLPSYNETFGLVYAEAAARMNVVIGHSYTGLYGIKQPGFFFCENKIDLYRIINDLCQMSRNDLEGLKLSNYQYASIFSEEKHFEALDNVYSTLLIKG